MQVDVLPVVELDRLELELELTAVIGVAAVAATEDAAAALAPAGSFFTCCCRICIRRDDSDLGHGSGFPKFMSLSDSISILNI